MAARLRTALWTGLAVLALLPAAWALWARPNASGLGAAWVESHPLTALGLVSGAGFLDGLNPCAITTLLLFVGAVLAALERAAAAADLAGQRRTLWSISGAYMGGMLLLYLALGFGFLQLAWIKALGSGHAITLVAAFGALLMGLLTVREYFIPDTALRIAMPASLHDLARTWSRQTTAGVAMIGGILIGLCTIPCAGGMYLGIAGLLGSLPSRLTGASLLLAYNISFVLPMALVVAAVGSRPALRSLSRWHINSRRQVKLVLGLTMVLIGLFVIWAA